MPDAPATVDIEAIVDAAFWASLRREENYLPRISLALLPPEQAVRPLLFDTPLPLGPVRLVRVAPAVERPGIHLGVWRNGSGARGLGHDAGDPAVLHGARSGGAGAARDQASPRRRRQVRERGGARGRPRSR